LLNPDGQIADAELVERLGAGDTEGILDEVADGGQHARDHIRVLHSGRARRDVLQQEAALTLDEEDLLHAVEQGMGEHDLAERPPGPQRLDPPRQRPPREAVLERAVQRVDHRGQARGHGLPDGRSHHREERVGQGPRVPRHRGGDGLLDRRGQGPGEVGVERALQERLRKHGAHLRRARGRIVEPRAQGGQLPLLGFDKKPAQQRELVVPAPRVGAMRASVRGEHGRVAHAATPRRP
jgi:hypothetical protein